MLKKLDDTLPSAEASNLESAELAGRFDLACRGVSDYLMTLIHGAVFEALHRGAERIDQDDLARVYKGKLAHQRAFAEQRNPFVGELDAAALDRVQPLNEGRVPGIGLTPRAGRRPKRQPAAADYLEGR